MSEIVDQPWSTYSDTTPQKRVITDAIAMMDPVDTPFLDRIGGLDGASGKFNFVNGESTHPEWLHGSLPALTSTLQAATIASNATSVTVADASPYKVGHIVEIDAQQFWVSAVNKTTEVLTVASLGGTEASHATGASVNIVGQARVEGADSDTSPSTGVTTASNYTNIFHAEIKVSETENVISKYGIGNRFDYEANQKVPLLMREIEMQILKNAIISAGSASTPRVMGGIPAFLTENSASGATLSRAKIEAVTKLIFDDGGMGPWVMPMTSTDYAYIKQFLENTGYLRVTQDETEVGMKNPAVIHTAYGDVYPMLDRWAVTGKAYLVDVNNVGMLTLRPFTQVPLGKNGDSERGEVKGEFTLCVRLPNSHGYLHSISAPA